MNYIKIGAKVIKLHAQDSSKKFLFVWQGNLSVGKTVSPAATLPHKDGTEEIGSTMLSLHVPFCEIPIFSLSLFFYICRFNHKANFLMQSHEKNNLGLC